MSAIRSGKIILDDGTEIVFNKADCIDALFTTSKGRVTRFFTMDQDCGSIKSFQRKHPELAKRIGL